MTPLRQDPRVRAVVWRDLTTLTAGQKVVELTLSLPWLVLSLMSFQWRWFPLGLAAAFLFFLTALRQAHGAQHYSLGVPRLAQDLLLAALSVMMLSSLHALQATHMHHHRHALEDSDIESATARLPWWKAVLTGPWFIIALNVHGYALATPRGQRWIRMEWATMVAGAAWTFSLGPAGARFFLIAMIAGECLTGFFAVWTVHHDCDPAHQLARTQRGWWKTALTYQMFYHVEHHLFPAVPTPRLPELASRLDRAMPHLRSRQVF